MKKLILIISLFLTNASFAQQACHFTSTNAGALNVFTFTPAAVLQGYFYHWNFGDNHTSTAVSPVHTYNATGNFQVSLSIYDSSQHLLCDWIDSVTVSNPSGGGCSFTSTMDVVSNTAVFTAQPSSSASLVTWDLGDGHAGSGNHVTHVYARDTIYTVCMTETSALTGAVLCSTCHTVNTGSAAGTNCSFTFHPDSASGLPVPPILFNANVPAGSTVAWDFGDHTNGSGSSVHHIYNSIGTFLVCMTSTLNGVTCTYCDTITTGNHSGPCTFSFAPDPGNSSSITFAAVPSSLLSGIHWNFGDNHTGLGNVVTHAYSAPGVYQVCMQEFINGAIVCTSCLTVTIGANSPNCHAFFTSANLGLTGYFVDLSNGSSTGFAYQWDFGDNTSSTMRFPHHTYFHPGTYNVCLNISDHSTPACTDQFCSTITVDTLININPVCSAYFVILQLAPYQFAVVNLTSGVNLNFHWDFGDGSPVSNVAFPSHHYAHTGTYLLCLTVTDQGGCLSSYCDTLSVDSLGNIHFRGMSGFDINVLSPSALTGVQEISGSQIFAVYPNPVMNRLTIAMTDEMKFAANYKVMALDGKEVTQGKINQRVSNLNVSNWNAGVYILEVQTDSGVKSYQKIIKE